MELKAIKRIAAVILTVILACTLSVSLFGAEVLSIRGVSIAMPEINIELKGTGYDAADISASFDSEQLTVESAEKYESGKHTTRTIILLDLSTSMYGYFDLAKENIINYINNAGDNDKIILITFGETEVITLLDGSESRTEAADAIRPLRCDDDGTLFFEALSVAYQITSSSPEIFDRQFALVFSDGMDYQFGKTTYDEVTSKYSDHSLPIYAVCPYFTAQSVVDKFGEVARSSGGEFSIINSKETFDDYLNLINDVTIVKLKASTNNITGGVKQLVINAGGLNASVNVQALRSKPDDEAPTVTGIEYKTANNEFVVTFSEKVAGANLTNAYKITDQSGNFIALKEVFYDSSNNEYKLLPADVIYTGSYTVEFFGITDVSKEANPLIGKVTVSAVGAEPEEITEPTEEAVEEGFPLWAIIVIIAGGLLLIAILVIVILLSVKKKKNHEEPTGIGSFASVHDEIQHIAGSDDSKHHIMTDSSVRALIKVKTGNTMEQGVETNIGSSVIIGRSSTCDIYIDDPKMSRQHFVIENDNGILFITDLQSRNGTFLNGTRVLSRQRLNSGDKVSAGSSTLSITVINR